MRKTIMAAAVLALAAGSVLPVNAEAKDETRDELVIGMTQFPSTFHPNIDSMMAKSYIMGATRRPITSYGPGWNKICLMCTEMPTLENGGAVREKTPDGKDGIAVTYKLDPNLKWGDGTPLTARDVIFTWEVGRHPKSGVAGLEFYRRAYKVAAPDDHTVTFHYDKVTFDYNSLLLNILPAHLDRDVFRENPSEYRNRTLFDRDPANPGLYFGPYVISEVKSGERVILTPNPHWAGAKPHFRRVVVRSIQNTAAIEANLLSGDIDMIAGQIGLTIDQGLAFKKRHGDRYRVVFKPGLIYEHIDLNLDNPILQDRRVREALILSIDRNALSEQLFEGQQPVADSNVNPLDWVADPNVPKWPFDPARAGRLLDEAGWSVKRRGIRHNAKGERLTLEIMTTAGNRTRELVEQVLQSQWRQAGIEVKIRNQPPRVFFGQTVSQRRFTAMAMFAWISAPESVPRTTLHSDHVPTAENNWGGQNYTGFRNADADRLIEEIEVELDRARREKLWHRFQKLYATELPVIPLYFRANTFIMPKWLTGVTPTGHQAATTLWIENWRAVSN